MSRILSTLTIISTLVIASTVQAVTTDEFVEFNEEYTQDYFNYLLFKKNSLNAAAELKKEISKLQTEVNQSGDAFVNIDSQLRLINEELDQIPLTLSQKLELISMIENNIASLRQDAVSKGYFTQGEEISSGTIDFKVSERVDKINTLVEKINVLKNSINVITDSENYNLVFSDFTQTQTTLNSRISERNRILDILDSLKSNLIDTKEQIRQLQKDIPSYRQRQRELSQTLIPSKRKEELRAETDYDEVSLDVEAYRAQTQNLRRKKLSAENSIDLLTKEERKVLRKLNGFKNELSDINEKWALLPDLRQRRKNLRNNRIPQAQTKLDQDTLNVQNQKKTTKALREKLNKKQNQINNVQTQLDTAVGNRKKQKAKVTKLQGQIKTLQEQVSSLQQLKKRRTNLNQNLIPTASTAVQTLKDSLANGATQAANAQTAAKEAKNKLKKANDRKTTLQRNVKTANQELKKLRTRLKRLKEQSNTESLKKQIANTKKRLTQQTSVLKTDRANLQKTRQSRDKIKTEIDRLTELCKPRGRDSDGCDDPTCNTRDNDDNCRARIAQLKRQFAKANKNLKAVNVKFKATQEQIKKIKTRLANLEGKLADGDKIAKRIKNIKNNLIPAQEKIIANSNATIAKLTPRITKLSAAFDKAQKEFIKVNGQQKKIQKSLTKAATQLKKLQTELTQIKAKIQTAKQAQEKINTITPNLQTAKQALKTAREAAQTLKTKIEELNVQLKAQKTTFNNQKIKRDKAITANKTAQADLSHLEEGLEKVKARIQRIKSKEVRRNDLRTNIIPNQSIRAQNIAGQIDDLETSLNATVRNLVQSRRSLRDAEDDLDDASARFSRLSEELENLVYEETDLDSKISTAEDDLASQQSRKASLESRTATNESDLDQVEREVSITQIAFDKANQAYQVFYNANILPLDREIEGHESSIETHRFQIADLNTLKVDTEELIALIEDTRNEITDLESRQNQLNIEKTNTLPVWTQLKAVFEENKSLLSTANNSLSELRENWIARADQIALKEKQNDEMLKLINDEIGN